MFFNLNFSAWFDCKRESAKDSRFFSSSQCEIGFLNLTNLRQLTKNSRRRNTKCSSMTLKPFPIATKINLWKIVCSVADFTSSRNHFRQFPRRGSKCECEFNLGFSWVNSHLIFVYFAELMWWINCANLRSFILFWGFYGEFLEYFLILVSIWLSLFQPQN